jgi:succinoglycan biosynthesis protein ExoO
MDTVNRGIPAAAVSGERAHFTNGDPRVSVIIPAYNVDRSIETAVGSVLRQTEQDFEIIIVDDGSGDDTRAIAFRLAAEDLRIRVIGLLQNRGRTYAMNFGMKEARGRWIAVLDGDDWYAPERLERLLEIADSRHLDMVADDWIAVDSEAGVALESPLPRRAGNLPLDLDTFLAHSKPTARADLGMLKHIMRAEFVRNTAIEYHPRARNGQDFYFLLSFFLAGGRGLLVNQAYYYYVEPFGTISRRGSRPGRRRYKFELLISVNDEFLATFGPTLTNRQRDRLKARGRAWSALIALHEFAEALGSHQYGHAAKGLIRAPPRFWGLLTSRLAGKVKTHLFGLRREVLGHIEIGSTVRPERDRPTLH